MRRSTRTIATLLALLVLPLSQALGQETGTVRGTVLASDGSGLAGAAVKVEGTGIGTLATEGGAFVLEGVPTGTQTLTASMIGYSAQSKDVDVPPGGSVTLDFALSISALNLETIVVTGTATEERKLETSYSITSYNTEQIEEKAPQSTAQLLEVVPGFYVEASGGEAGNNVWARGIPQDGSFRYVAMYEDGLPVFEAPELAFTNIDLLFRNDETVRSMEAVRGGTAPIFASNAPGGLINFVSKTGGTRLSGIAKMTVGTYGLFRTDLDVGGPITDNWRFNVGGFLRSDNGVRDPDFTANQGGQIKANLTRLLDNGYVRAYFKHLNDRNIFYLPVPLQNPDDPEGIPGFDPNYGTMTSLDAGLVNIPTPKNEVLHRDLKDGMHPVYTSFGAEGFLDLGDGWSVKEAFRNISTDVTFNAIFSVNNPVTAAGYAESQVENVLDVDCTVIDCSNYYQYSFTHDGPIPGSAANTLNGNGLVVESGWWTVTKPLRNIVNDLRVSKEFSGEIENTITGGFYFSDYSADEFWLFNNVLQEVRDAPRLLDLTILDDGGDPVVDVTDNGFTRYGALYRNASSNARVWALYLQDEWQATPRLKIDGGLRYEYATFKGNVEARSVYDLGDPNTLADDRMEYGNGDFLPYNFDHDNVAWSIGANYMFTQQFGMFGRFTDAFRMPDFEQWTDGSVNSAGQVEDILQGEVGVKYGSPQLGVFATGFWSQLKDTPFTDEVVVDGDLITLRRFANTRTIGVETEAVWIPWNTLQFNWTGTLQQPEYTNLRFDLPPGVSLDLPPDFNIDGNRIRRVPRYISSLRGSYTLPPEAGNLKFWLTWNYIDKRFVDDANNVTLPAYNRVDGGLQFDVGPRVQVQLVGNNLTNEIGLTEGNPRVGQVVGVQQDIYMARPILGANGRLSIAYRF